MLAPLGQMLAGTGGISESPLFPAMGPAELHQQTTPEGLLCVSSTTPQWHPPCSVLEAPSFLEPVFSCLRSSPEKVEWGQAGDQKPLGQGQHPVEVMGERRCRQRCPSWGNRSMLSLFLTSPQVSSVFSLSEDKDISPWRV